MHFISAILSQMPQKKSIKKSFVQLAAHHMSIFPTDLGHFKIKFHRVISVHIAHSKYHVLYSVAG